MKRPYRWKLALLALGVLAVLAWFGWRQLRATPPLPAEKIIRVERGDIARSVVAIGQIEARTKVEVKSKANGILEALLVDVGDTVREGQVLAELDKENLRAQVREASATLDAEQANLNLALATQTRAKAEAANPALPFAEREFRRVEDLFQQQIASRQALEDAQRAYEVARNQQELLAANLTMAEAGIQQAHARVAAAQAALDRAQENLRYATIRSPLDGLVLSRETEVGDAVSSILNLGSAATRIMTLGDLSTVYVKGEIDEADVGRIQVGLPVRTLVESFPDEKFAGTVTRVAPMGREQNNVTTFEVRVSIANPQGRLRVNMSANAEVVLEERRQALLIPESALTYDKDRKAFVQRLDPSARPGFRRVAVEVGISNGLKAEIRSGLSETDSVVLP